MPEGPSIVILKEAVQELDASTVQSLTLGDIKAILIWVMPAQEKTRKDLESFF